jgi:hypothetical protein
MDGDAECLPLPNQHEQPLAPRHSCVDQVALEQHVVWVATGITTAGNSEPCDLWIVMA